MPSPKRYLLRAVVLLGGSSAVSLFIGLLTSKIYAIRLGPAGLGYWGLLTSLLALGVLIFGLGISTGIIRLATISTESRDTGLSRLSTYRRAAWQILAVIAVATTTLFLLFRQLISKYFLGDLQPLAVFAVLIAILLGIASSLQISTLNVQRHLKLVAQTNIMTSVLGAIFGICIVWVYGQSALPFVLIVSQAIVFVTASFHVYRTVPRAKDHSSMEIRLARTNLLKFGLPYTISSLVGGGVQQLIPLFILHNLGQTEVGFFRAVISLTNTYLSLMQSTLAQDYYVRIASAKGAEAITKLVQEQSRVVIGIAVPIILLVQGLGFVLLPLLFTSEFLPALEFMRWQLVGDILKIFSWLVAFFVLAKLPPHVYFINELLNGAATVISVWLLVSSLGLAGVGISTIIAYLLYILALSLWSGRVISFGWLRSELGWWLLAALCVLGVGLLSGPLQVVTGLSLSLIWAWRFLWQKQYAIP